MLILCTDFGVDAMMSYVSEQKKHFTSVLLPLLTWFVYMSFGNRLPKQ